MAGGTLVGEPWPSRSSSSPKRCCCRCRGRRPGGRRRPRRRPRSLRRPPPPRWPADEAGDRTGAFRRRGAGRRWRRGCVRRRSRWRDGGVWRGCDRRGGHGRRQHGRRRGGRRRRRVGRGQAGEVQPADRRWWEVLAQVFGERVLPVDGADEALPPQRQRVAALGQHVVRLERVRRPEELEHVGVVDQLADALLPVLAAAEVVRVDQVLVAEELDRARHGLDHLGVGVGVRREHLAEAPRARPQGPRRRPLADAHAQRELPDDDRADEDAHAAAGDGRGVRADAEAEVGPVDGLLPTQLDRGRVERGPVQPGLDQECAAPPERPGAVGGQGPVGARLRAEHALGLAPDLGQRIRFLRAALGGVREHEQPAPAVHEDGRGSVDGELDVLVHPHLVERVAGAAAVVRPGASGRRGHGAPPSSGAREGRGGRGGGVQGCGREGSRSATTWASSAGQAGSATSTVAGIASRNAAGQRSSDVSSPATITSPVCQDTACWARSDHAGSVMVVALRATTTTSAVSTLASAAVQSSGDEPGGNETASAFGKARTSSAAHASPPPSTTTRLGLTGGPPRSPTVALVAPTGPGDPGQVRSPAARPAMCSGLTPQHPPTTVTPWATQVRVTSTSSSTPITSTKTQSGMANRPLSG